MSIAVDLLKSEHIGIRDLKEHMSKVLKKRKTFIVTDRGVPINVILPYSDIVELADIMEELSDSKTIEIVREGRLAIKSGSKGVPVSRLFRKKLA